MIKEKELYKLSEIGTIVGGATPATSMSQYYGGDIPWITPKDLSNFHGIYIERGERNITQEGLDSCSAQLLPTGTVLFSSRAPIGYVAIAKNPLATNQGFKSVIPDTEKVDSLFLYYLLVYNKNNIEKLGSGTTFKEVSGTTMKNVEVALPSLAEQKWIANILSVLDDKIELNRRINENLEQQVQALFKHWFVDYEFPDEDGKPYKSSGGKFAKSELGDIPSNWEIGCVNDIVEIQSGYAFKSDSFVQEGRYRLITIKNVQDGSWDMNGAAHLDTIPHKMPSHCILRYGDMLLSLTGNVGRCCIVDREELLLNQRVAKLQYHSINYRLFIYTIFRNESFKKKLISIARGTAQMNLSPIETGQIKIAIPDSATIKKFYEKGDAIYMLLLNNRRENIYLSELRDILLQKLMNGDL